jgi:glycerophosphoryl diester phosphodiesterase
VSSPGHPALARGGARVFAHRGGARLAPENTLAAFDRGVGSGADGLELDVRLSRDGVVVVHHDATLERTTNARGALADLTADELARLDAAYWFDAPGGHPYRGRQIGIPRLQDVLRRYRDVAFIIELKVDSTDLAERTVAEVRKADAVDRVAIGSFRGHVLRVARSLAPDIPTGASTAEVRWLLWRSRLGVPTRRTSYRVLQVPEVSGQTHIVSPRFVRAAHRADLPVQVWTIDHGDDMRRLLAWGVDALITDRPDLAMEIARGRRAEQLKTED